ncbi:MAG: DUF222 domain-containing protein [Anaerolineales bacterium]|nr:DUF222 domain-containing protein [Anaerolineales bacterium]
MQEISRIGMPMISSLGERITELVAHLDAGTYQLLVLIGEFDAKQEWGCGIQSCAHWLNIYCGMGVGAARERVRVARALPGLRKISKAFSAGRVSYSKVRAMTRVANPENEEFLLNMAMYGTANQVEKLVRHYRRHQRFEKLAEDNVRFSQRRVNLRQDDDDTWVINGRLTAEQGALLKKALDLGVEQLFQEQKGVPEEVEEEEFDSHPMNETWSELFEARRSDALARMAEAFIASDQSQACGGDAYLVNIHTDVDTLMDDGEGAASELEDGCHVSAETSRRLSCDASVVHWLDTHKGEPLSIGRKSRTIPPAIRRALHRRDKDCRFPGCTCSRFVDAHHIHHWADGGETKMDNLILLCRRHHRLVHEEGYGIQVCAHGDIKFTLPDGRELKNNYHGRFRGNVMTLKARNEENDLEITPFTNMGQLDGTYLDYQHALDVLIQLE